MAAVAARLPDYICIPFRSFRVKERRDKAVNGLEEIKRRKGNCGCSESINLIKILPLNNLILPFFNAYKYQHLPRMFLALSHKDYSLASSWYHTAWPSIPQTLSTCADAPKNIALGAALVFPADIDLALSRPELVVKKFHGRTMATGQK